MEAPRFAIRTAGLAIGRPGLRGAVLEDVALAVAPGECVSIEGATGSGKSTLLRALAGLSGVEQRAGTLECPRSVAFLAQHVETQLLCTTVGEEVGLGSRQQGLCEARVAERSAAALDAVGLAGFERREVDTLSAGQRQRVVIAALLALEPGVMLLDEPTSALDPAARVALGRTLEALASRGTAIVVADHAPAELMPRFHRRFVVEKGRLHERSEATRDEVAPHHTAPGRSRDARENDRLRQPDEVVLRVDASGLEPLSSFGEIRSGERLLLTGPNGAGKSSWLRVLAVQAEAQTRALWGRPGPPGGRVAFVIQEPRRSLFARTVVEEVGFALERRGVSRAERRSRVDELLARFELLECAERSPLRLSFGQQHRLAIAAALAAGPALALLDEPFSGLDPAARTALLDLLAHEQARVGTAIVIASHDRAPLDAWCDRVIELHPRPAARPEEKCDA